MAKKKRSDDEDILEGDWEEVRDGGSADKDDLDGDDGIVSEDDIDVGDDEETDDAAAESDDEKGDDEDSEDDVKAKSSKKPKRRKRARKKSADDEEEVAQKDEEKEEEAEKEEEEEEGAEKEEGEEEEKEEEEEEEEEEEVEPEPDHPDAVAALKDIGARVDLNKWESVWRIIFYEQHDDSVIERFHGLPCLKEIWLLGTKVTEEGYEALKERMPELTIYYK